MSAPATSASSAPAALLMLGDGRLPAGGYAHSAGLEQAISRGDVRTADDLASFLRGRVHTTCLVSSAFAAAGRDRTAAALERDDLAGLSEQLDELEAELVA